MDFEVQAAVSNPATCTHAFTPTKYVQSNGVDIVRQQCIFCGTAGQALKKSDYDLATLADFDECFRERGNEQREHERLTKWEETHAHNVIEQAIVQQRVDADNSRWWEDYNLYLSSMEWRLLRRRILDRDRDRCQGCLTKQGVEVHHLSYEMYNATGHSMAFECVTLCRECHDRIHPHMKETRRKITTASWMGM